MFKCSIVFYFFEIIFCLLLQSILDISTAPDYNK